MKGIRTTFSLTHLHKAFPDVRSNDDGPAHAAVPRGRETQSGVQRSGRATRERVLREVRDVAEREIELVRSDVFEQLRAEIHGKRTGDPEQDATRMTTKRGRRTRRILHSRGTQ